MISHFLNLEWKQFFRSANFGKSIALKIIMTFFALYFLLSFLAIGAGSFFIIKEKMPNVDPLVLVNQWLIFSFLVDLIVRYLMQKLPVMNIKPLLLLPIQKNNLTHYLLSKSIFSVFNVLSLFFFVPFAVVLISQGYHISGVLGWLFFIVLCILSSNFINFLINKSNVALGILLTILGVLFMAYKYELLELETFFGGIFQGVYERPLLGFLMVPVVLVLYYLNFKNLRAKVYLDDAITGKSEEAKSLNLSWVESFGEVAPFIKNDIRQIWRNKRTKTVFFMSFLFLFYGIIFFGNPVYEDKMPAFLVFAALFITGGFTINYGQFIPAWDSEYYAMLMSQNIKYREYLESKWYLMVVMTSCLYFLSLPYIFYGLDKFLLVTVGAIFNIGFNSIFLLYAGSFNRKRVELNKSGFGNTQGTSATQFLIIIPVMGLPMLLFWVFNKFLGFHAGITAVAVAGILCIVFKNFFMKVIEKKYKKDKYAAIHAFSQTS